ncbi:hypothetical protein A2627_01965 [Candidatus Woesebacteria bacterium RIFCSPHIGHO2_01_FULL_39_28]|uniref:Pyrrolo-quinoline quinone repeat domain-containing protein n=1 Tax=Candidatus Woesebacteria bacterium RIFCSPHIGHO2_01_FULL_39_28 TaxID=1802496 RepID=A0A1F7YMP3_9BACT|nr:MAG: hypothetical protein A2627_01965 [Candidatus Woesebacteria bacterium RIFCSPHIGHO2_01_FULL_39_28]OGM56770.1 MAG: hypothetical protein A3A50_04160 [Candidatus Woesebacteria bacterium RIFCSPLOWO2_01_FULL_38_20]
MSKKLSGVIIFLGVLLVVGGVGLTRRKNKFIVPVRAQTLTYDWPQFQHDVKRTGYNPQDLSAPFTQKWARDLGGAVAERVQPVISGGILVIGDINGKVFGLNETTGVIVWTFQTGAAVSYSAAIDQGKVFVSSQDGYLYALNLSNGAKLWQAKVGNKPVGGAPVIYNNVIYIGGKDGYFYAFNATDGTQRWKFDSAISNPITVRSPIIGNASLSPIKNRLFFSAENVVAYSLDLNGSLIWAKQMYGESTYETWPVVSETNNVVMFQTKSVYSFHSSLGLDDGDLFCPGDMGSGCGSCANSNPDNFDAPSNCDTVTSSCSDQWNEQHGLTNSIDSIFDRWPQRRTFYSFNMDTGALIPAPILWTGGGGRPQEAPVVNEASGNVYLLARTKWSRRDTGYFCRKWVDIVRLSFTSAQGTFNYITCGSGIQCPASDSFHFIGDETTVLSMSGNLVVGTGWYHTGSIRVDTGVQIEVSPTSGLGQGTNGTGGDHAAPAAIANKVVFVKQFSGEVTSKIVAYQGK